MQAAELIVELVLTGLLMLGALLLPAHQVGSWPFRDNVLEPFHDIAWAVGAGFVLGVVVDRCADSILARWEAIVRCKFAWRRNVSCQRNELIGGAGTVRDPFPEDWMRIHVMSTGQDGALRWMDQLRIRLRIARTVAVLVPALTTSAVLAVCAEVLKENGREESKDFVVALALIHAVFLGVAFQISDCKAFKPPRTSEFATARPKREVFRRAWWFSPMTYWLALELVTALGVLAYVLASAPKTGRLAYSGPVILLVGAVVSAIAIQAWKRINGTFMGFLWNVCRLRAPESLKEACL